MIGRHDLVAKYMGYEAVNYDPITGTMLALTAIGGAVSSAGTLMAGNAAAQAGQMQNTAKQYQAAELNQEATQVTAVAQRKAIDRKLQTDYAVSKLQARASSDGGSGTDTGVLNLTSDIASRGKYFALADQYQGDNQAAGLRAEAAGDIYTGAADEIAGKEKQTASDFSAAGTIIGTGGSMFAQYNKLPQYLGRTA